MNRPCLGANVCDHWKGERVSWALPFPSTAEEMRTPVVSRLTHGDNPEHSREFTAGVMPDGLCDDGHDYALERWLREVMEETGCISKEVTP